jgi:hypothetical protein
MNLDVDAPRLREQAGPSAAFIAQDRRLTIRTIAADELDARECKFHQTVNHVPNVCIDLNEDHEARRNETRLQKCSELNHALTND